jgi:hypothetical protein
VTRTEFIIQLLKLAIGLAFGAYFVWWSLEVLDRLTPEEATVVSRVMRTPTHSFEPTREAAMAAFGKSCRAPRFREGRG